MHAVRPCTLFLVAALAIAGDAPPVAPPAPAPAPGSLPEAAWAPAARFTVKRGDLQVADPARSRTIAATVHYPVGDGPFPVIIFSHGLGGSKDSYEWLCGWWAMRGYVAIHPTHAGSDRSLFLPGKTILEMRPILKAALEDAANYEARPKDVSRLIDVLGELPTQLPGLAGLIDAKRIGVGGHSFGAYTVMALAGITVDLPGRADATFTDPRVSAFLALSPQGINTVHDEKAWAGITRPLMVMTGSNDNQAAWLNPPGEAARPGTWRARTFALMPPGDKYLVWIEGAYHSTFNNSIGAQFNSDPDSDPRAVACVMSTGLAFWDTWLKADAKARAYLDGGEATTAFGKDLVRCERK